MKTQCVYCGTSNPETKDHIPPKNLFPQPRPELVTVPCCEKCHKPTSLDDEIFRNMLTMSRNAEYHPDIPKILDKVRNRWGAGAIGRAVNVDKVGRQAPDSKSNLAKPDHRTQPPKPESKPVDPRWAKMTKRWW